MSEGFKGEVSHEKKPKEQKVASTKGELPDGEKEKPFMEVAQSQITGSTENSFPPIPRPVPKPMKLSKEALARREVTRSKWRDLREKVAANDNGAEKFK